MESLVHEIFDSAPASAASSVFCAETPAVLTGAAEILRVQPRLAQLANACGQPGAADYIHYFLTQPYTGQKVPTLLLFQRPVANGSAPTIAGAVLLHQHRRLGFPLGIYVSEDLGGERNVIAPPAFRTEIAMHAAHYLLAKRRARLVVLSVKNARLAAFAGETSACWASTSRVLHRYLPLQNTYDQTLADFGSHTRRNFRLYRRRAEAALECSFAANADVSEAEFIAMNEICDYPVPPDVARWRYQSAHTAPGGVFSGLRAQDGTWLSIVGGRRYHGTFALDWQMNRTELSQFSPSTLMRGYLMEHEISLGTTQILFEGGTPHPMNSAFAAEEITDIVSASSSRSLRFLIRHAHRVFPEKNFLTQTLSDKSLQWHGNRFGSPS